MQQLDHKQKQNGAVWLGIIAGILSVVVLTALAVALLLSGNWLYRLEIGLLKIPETSGYAKELILTNYDAVIRFLSPFRDIPFAMPDLAASAGGVRHFEDVKVLVVGLYYVGIAALALGGALLVLFQKKIGSRTYLAASIASLGLPVAIISGIALDFDGFFVLFHKIFFNNDDWIFNPSTDPVIKILPETYFMHCAIILALFWIIGSVIYFLFYKKSIKNTKQKSGEPTAFQNH